MTKDIAYYLLILGLQSDFDENELKQAYRKEAKKWHPDLNKNDVNAEERLKLINDAYEFLSGYKKQEFTKVENISVNDINKKSTKRNDDSVSSQNKNSRKEKAKGKDQVALMSLVVYVSVALILLFAIITRASKRNICYAWATSDLSDKEAAKKLGVKDAAVYCFFKESINKKG
ncbi:Heat shock protein DnaJ-like protein [Prochlorococcus marinus str. MIT 9312]|uniref:Heat shock protein DnaJ-like protein n=1 Tax=Prochlorococcus marinus (strain MIT 9312) TaxID=74546 RepID=Q31A98_PROM9|nr:Heat shock protein DnaJ-like protein [Prochlorococcus marinus str. MIT 9312]KGG00007.1 DnaJ-class molecular chaperone CbpA [Prochlorococcus marinus str. MIT 9311]